MWSDALIMTLLYDYYGELLTEKQRGLCSISTIIRIISEIASGRDQPTGCPRYAGFARRRR